MRSATGITSTDLPDGRMSFCVSRGDALLQKYLRATPASGADLEDWVQDAATSFGAYYAHLALASERAPFYYYARDLSLDRGAEFLGHSYIAETWFAAAKRVADMHGRTVIFQKVEATDSKSEGSE